MKNKKFKITLLSAALCFTLVGCSNDDSTENLNSSNESGVVNNEEITLTYGNNLLNHYVQNMNEPINIEGMNGASARSGNSILAFDEPDETSAIDVTTLQNNANLSTGTYILNTDQTSGLNLTLSGSAKFIIKGNFTGNLNLSGGTLYIMNNMSSLGGIQLNGGNINIAPGKTVTINKTVKGNLKNYGTVTYENGSLDGTIENNGTMTFSQSVNFNGSSTVTNKCTMYFNESINLNKLIRNEKHLEFNSGINFNSGGNIVLASGAFLKINGNVTNNQPGAISSEGTAYVNILTSNLANLNQTLFSGSIILHAPQANFSNSTWPGVIKNENPNPSTPGDCTTTSNTCSIASLDEQARYVGHVASPIIEGKTLSATDVKVVGNKAYVSYHTNDEIYGGFPYGSVRVFDIATNGSVVLQSEANFNNCEFNALTINDNKIFAVGNNLDGGRMFIAPLNNNNSITTNLSAVWSSKTPGLGGKSIAFEQSNLWLATGSNGGLYNPQLINGTYVFDNNSLKAGQTGGKYVAFNANKQVFFAINTTGNPYLRIAETNGLSPIEATDTSITLTNRDGKNTIALDNEYVYVALSEQGVAKYSLADGSLVSRFIPSTIRNANGSRTFPKNGLSNAVTVDNCFVYIANGADGVIILNKDTFQHVGHFKTGLNHSTNFVYAKDNYLFVANGRDGLRVIKLK